MPATARRRRPPRLPPRCLPRRGAGRCLRAAGRCRQRSPPAWDPRLDPGRAAARAGHRERTVDPGEPGGQSGKATARLGVCAALTVVLYEDSERAVELGDSDHRCMGVSMLVEVGDRFGDDEVGDPLGLARRPSPDAGRSAAERCWPPAPRTRRRAHARRAQRDGCPARGCGDPRWRAWRPRARDPATRRRPPDPFARRDLANPRLRARLTSWGWNPSCRSRSMRRRSASAAVTACARVSESRSTSRDSSPVLGASSQSESGRASAVSRADAARGSAGHNSTPATPITARAIASARVTDLVRNVSPSTWIG